MPVQIDKKQHIQVFKYSIELLRRLLAAAAAANTTEETVQRKKHFDYFKSYFSYFLAKGPITIVVEWEYTDRDFLEDYAAYYVRCFQSKYVPECARLHFFQADFDETQLRAVATTGKSESLDAQALDTSYLGFVVVKPLPRTFVGRTCLKTYDSDGSREFSVKRTYEAHLLGMTLTVESLAFQEQDTVVAACATSALWSALQGTAMLFQHQIWSPVEITRVATEQFPGLQRDVPNKGLTPLQMAAAIKKAGLEPVVVGVATPAILQATVYAYLRARIPLIMNTAMYDVSGCGFAKPYRGGWDEGHAVAVTGYSLGKADCTAHPDTGTLLRSSRIDKLYVHDDQVGPFARLEFGPQRLFVAHGRMAKTVPFTMRSSWAGRDGIPGSVCFGPEAIIVPVYHKIRIDFYTILLKILRFDAYVRANYHITPEPEWEVFLTTEDEFKASVCQATGLPPTKRWDVLRKAFPKYLWRATAFQGGTSVHDRIYDATDIDQGELLILTLDYAMP